MIKKRDGTEDFCLLDSNPESRLTPFERLTITGGAELQRAIDWMAKQFLDVSSKHSLEGFSIKDFFGAVDYYKQVPWRDSPEQFFAPPLAPQHVELTPVHGLKDGEILDIKFPSAYRVHNASFSAEYESYKENQAVHARMWKHHDNGAPTMIAIHGWTMGDQRLNSLAFLPGLFYGLGIDVVLIELPYHGRRRPAVAKEQKIPLFPSAHMVRTNETMGQVICDLRQLASYLRQNGTKEIGVAGMSLGGYLAALWASLDPLSFCIPIVPMVSMAELEWEIISRHEDFKKLKEEGIALDLLRELYHVHCPLSHSPKLAKERMLLVAGIGDQIVPPRQPKMLWDHWRRPRMLWFTGGHVAQFKRSRAFGEIINFLRELGYVTSLPDSESDELLA